MSKNKTAPKQTPKTNVKPSGTSNTKDAKKTVDTKVVKDTMNSKPFKKEDNEAKDIAKVNVVKEKEPAKSKTKADEMPMPNMMPNEVKKAMAPVKNSKPKKKHNYILWAGIIVILIPCLLLGWLLISTREKAGTPTVGERFDKSLDPAITTQQVSDVKAAMAFDQVDQVEVNLISATLRINIDVQDDMSEDAIKNIAQEAYENVHGILPIETYFTNKDSDKMYDIEINVYNFIPEEGQIGQVHVVKSKTAAAESDRLDVLTTAKNSEVAEELLNPDLTVPETAE